MDLIGIIAMSDQVLNGFVLVVTADGLVFYVSSTLQDYLGFNQSDVIHQSVYELIHTEDRAEFQRQLHWALNPGPPPDSGQIVPAADNGLSLPVTYYNPEKLPPENSTFLERNFVCRLRCLLDNSSGFLALNFQGRLKFLHGQNTKSKDGSTIPPQLALFVVATPLQPPSILEIRTRNFIFRTKHKLDFTPTACDAKGKIVLGYTEAELCYHGTGYQFIHAADMLYCAENHIRISQHHQPLNVTDMNYPVNDFNTLELEDFLESLQPCPETPKRGISPQDSMITSQTYYTGAVSMYQCLPETQSTSRNQVNQINQMVFSPGTSQQQTFLPKFQNGYNETYPEPYSLMDCTQPKQPLHCQQSETRPNSDPTSSGFP
ncbi:UNVERIFIED_CONTAM: hypothetical protein FKN15_042909 [Acipenser sinensis]